MNFIYVNLWFIIFCFGAMGNADVWGFDGIYKHRILALILGILVGLFEAALCLISWAAFYKFGNAWDMSILYAICIWLGYLAVGTFIELLIKRIIKCVKKHKKCEQYDFS